MDDDERSALVDALPRLRDRVAEVTAQWSAVGVGEAMTITWSPRRPAQVGCTTAKPESLRNANS